jgi:AraC-like DNA-binding protein
MDDKDNDIQQDALSHFLARVRFDAEIFKHKSYCGSWAIDTAGSGKIPFHFIDKGKAWVHVQGSEPQLLQAGDLVLFPRDIPHAISNHCTPPPAELINSPVPLECDLVESFTSILCGFYVFESTAAQLLLADLPAVTALLNARDNPATTSIGHIIDATLIEAEADYPGRTAALCDLARLMLLHLLRGYFAEGASTGFLAALSDPKISKALLLIHSRYGENWTLDNLAKEVGMSRTAFAGRFHDLVGLPPAKYLAGWRMQEATTLLENTSLSVEQIAEQVGYQSDVSFRKAYKSTTGLTPKQVRTNKREPLLGKVAKLLQTPFST